MKLPFAGTRTEEPESPTLISGNFILEPISSLLITLSAVVAISPILPGDPVDGMDLLLRLASNNFRVASFVSFSSSLETNIAFGS